MCLLWGWQEPERDMLITHGVLRASSVYILDPPSQSGASNWLHRLCQSRGEPVFYGRSCLFCCLTTLAIVGLGKAGPYKEMEKASFDRVRSHMYLPCQMKSLSMEEDPPMVRKETGTLSFFKFLILCWSTADKQCCDCFRWPAKEPSHAHTCIHSPPNSPPTQAAT